MDTKKKRKEIILTKCNKCNKSFGFDKFLIFGKDKIEVTCPYCKSIKEIEGLGNLLSNK